MPPKKKREFPKMTEAEVVEGLRTRHVPAQWCFMPGFANNCGFNITRTYDVYCIGLWKADKHERRVYEVKVSRSDFLHELKHPKKRESALTQSNTFYFAVPHGMVEKDEVPEECGLIWVKENGECHTVKKAPFRPMADEEKVSYGIFMSMANRASDATAQNRLYQAMEWKQRKRNDKNPFNRVMRYLKMLVDEGDDLAHPISMASLPSNSSATAEQNEQYKAEGVVEYWERYKHHSKLWNQRFTIEHARLNIKRIVYTHLGLTLPEHEVEPDYLAMSEARREEERAQRRKEKKESAAILAEYRKNNPPTPIPGLEPVEQEVTS